LINQAAGGYVDYDPSTKLYSLSQENALVLADESSEFFAGGGFQVFGAFLQVAPRIVDCIRTGEGLSWGDQPSDVFEGTERFFRPAYNWCLVPQWIPSIPGLKEKLEAGATVADVGCGHGISTLAMARAFPRSRFYGFDSHQPSIDTANKKAKAEGLADRVTFHWSKSDDIPDHKYDLVAYFDCLHDMGDPVAACRRAKETIKSDGCLMIVEPMGGHTIEENFNDIGRAFSGASVLCCVPNAIASGKTALGTIASDDALKAVLKEAGFNSFRRAMETPFNRLFEARIG
jgi:2-polyprenyl-3-methyl-5-hydroxy-6-metoxy-1,4-benzoquinol methylase